MNRWLLSLGLLLAACQYAQPVDPAVSVPLEEAFWLRVGQQADVGDGPLQLRLEAVPEDSRCPVDVTCVWAGNARLQLRASLRGSPLEPVELNTTLEPRTGSVAGYRIVLQALEPAARAGHAIPREDYRAQLLVTRAEQSL